jgi:hypothetical protein
MDWDPTIFDDDIDPSSSEWYNHNDLEGEFGFEANNKTMDHDFIMSYNF